MADEFDAVRFFDELTEFVDQFSSGRSGLTALTRIIDLGLWTLPAPGSRWSSSGRPSAGSSRRADRPGSRSAAASSPAIPASSTCCGATGSPSAPTTTCRPNSATRSMAAARADTSSAGSCSARVRSRCWSRCCRRPDEWPRAGVPAMAYLTTMIARIYRDDAGLPLHADPAPRVPAETHPAARRRGQRLLAQSEEFGVIEAAEVDARRSATNADARGRARSSSTTSPTAAG